MNSLPVTALSHAKTTQLPAAATRRTRASPACPCASSAASSLPMARDTTSGFTKISTVVRLTGDGHEGQGEDITWDQIDQIEQLRGARRPLVAARDPHARRALDAPRARRPLPGRPDPRQLALLPRAGRSRARRSTSRCARTGSRWRAALGLEARPVVVRGVGPARRPGRRSPRCAPCATSIARPALQARSDRDLGRRPARRAVAARLRRRGRHEGPLRQRDGGHGGGPRSLPPRLRRPAGRR